MKQAQNAVAVSRRERAKIASSGFTMGNANKAPFDEIAVSMRWVRPTQVL